MQLADFLRLSVETNPEAAEMLRTIMLNSNRPMHNGVDPNAVFEPNIFQENPCGEILLEAQEDSLMEPELEGLEDEDLFDEPTVEIYREDLEAPQDTSWKTAAGALLVAATLSLFSNKKDV